MIRTPYPIFSRTDRLEPPADLRTDEEITADAAERARDKFQQQYLKQAAKRYAAQVARILEERKRK